MDSLRFDLEMALFLAGLAHLATLAAITFAPLELEWERHFRPLPRLLRQMCGVYSAYTGGTIAAIGLGSLVLAEDLADGSALARAVCGYVAVFWAVRLVLQFTYDYRPHLRRPWMVWAYHGLTPVFVGFVVVYGWAAFF